MSGVAENGNVSHSCNDMQLKGIKEAAAYISTHLPDSHRQIELGIVCGSGLSQLTSKMTKTIEIPYENIPNFPQSTVEGHGSKMVIGTLNGKLTLSLGGRFHYYEGYSIEETVLPIRVMALLGIKKLLLTNAAGGVDTSLNVGDVMVIVDHISFANFAGLSPLRGPNIQEFGPRFPSMTDAYAANSFQLIKEAARISGIDESIIKKGIYVNQLGPAYETRAEVRFTRLIGGSAVGMSTIPEVIVAVHAGMKVVAFSLITNKAVDSVEVDQVSLEIKPTHEEVLAVATQRSKQLENMVYNLAPML